jgi:hypothetical protein
MYSKAVITLLLVVLILYVNAFTYQGFRGEPSYEEQPPRKYKKRSHKVKRNEIAGDPSQWGVNAADSYQIGQRKVNEYEGQHRLSAYGDYGEQQPSRKQKQKKSRKLRNRVQGDPSQWGVCENGDPSQWGVAY